MWWLSKALADRGIDVTLACMPDSECRWATTVFPDFSKPMDDQLTGFDLHHYFYLPLAPPAQPHVVSIGGNGKPGEVFPRNTAFVSRNHARRHGAECFVYNGVDPDDYIFRETKDDSLLFLAKASWRVKNVAGAIRIARKAKRELNIVGGNRWLFNHHGGIHWHGMLGGRPKAERIARSSALLFPVLWNEPFGLAVVEALVSGTPVFATPWGSLPELIGSSVGRICRDDDDFLGAIEDLPRFKAKDCRDWALARFSHHHMAESYLELYEKALRNEPLNPLIPATQDPMEALVALPLRTAVENSAALPA